MTIEKVSIGFLFSNDSKYVSLMKRKFPSYIDSGEFDLLFTGIGGHVESGESYQDAMIREFEEEAGVRLDNWKQFALFNRTNLDAINDESKDLITKVSFFRAFSDKIFEMKKSNKEMNKIGISTVDSISVVPVDQIHIFKTYPNVKYLVHAALDGNIISLNINY